MNINRTLALALVLALFPAGCGGAPAAGDAPQPLFPAGAAEPAPAQPGGSAAFGASGDLSGAAPEKILIA